MDNFGVFFFNFPITRLMQKWQSGFQEDFNQKALEKWGIEAIPKEKTNKQTTQIKHGARRVGDGLDWPCLGEKG